MSRRVLVVVLVAYCAFLALVLLAPSSTQQSLWTHRARDVGIALGVDPVTLTQARAEFVCNALILMPVSALGSLLWRRTTWRDWTAVAFVAAGLVELAQGLFLPSRSATFVDIVANTLGGLGGAVFIALVRSATSERRQELH